MAIAIFAICCVLTTYSVFQVKSKSHKNVASFSGENTTGVYSKGFDPHQVNGTQILAVNNDPNGKHQFNGKDDPKFESENERWEKEYQERERRMDDPREFVKMDWSRGLPYGLVEKHIHKKDIPMLHKMLSDTQYKPYWPNIAIVIGMISDDANSVQILAEYFGRPDIANFTRKNLWTKIRCLAYLGKIGGDIAKDILTLATKKDGAAELAQAWIDSNLVPGDPGYGNRESVVFFIRQAAIDGLVFLRKPDANAEIDQLYKVELEKSLSTSKTQFCSLLIDAMAEKDYIKDYGLKSYLLMSTSGSISSEMDVMGPYIEKYSPWIQEMKKSIKNKTPGRHRLVR